MTDKVGTGAENTEYGPLLQTQSSSITKLFTTNSYP